MGCGASKLEIAIKAQEAQQRDPGVVQDLVKLAAQPLPAKMPQTPAQSRYEADLPQNEWTLDGTWQAFVGEGRINFVTMSGANGRFCGGSYGSWSNISMDSSATPPTLRADWHSEKFGSRGDLKGVFHGPRLATYEAGNFHSCVFQKLLDPLAVSSARLKASGVDLDAMAADAKASPGTMPKSPVEWGMTLTQMQHFRDYLQVSGEFNSQDGSFRSEPPNMYEINSKSIKPITNGTGLSLAALYNKQDSKPANVFISHSWAEQFLTFVANLETGSHKTQRPLRKDDVAWVCTFGVNQNADIAGELGDSPQESPFAVVLRSALEVVIVFNDHVDLYSRVWCCYEMYLALEWEKDVRSVGNPAGWHDIIASGCSSQGKEEKEAFIHTWNEKHKVNIKTAKASVEQDKRDIMNAIAKSGEEMFEKINQKISVLREVAWKSGLLEMHGVQRR